MENKKFEQDIRAEMFGMHTALAATIRALISTHPNPDALRAALSYEQQSALALLTASPFPDHAIDAFRRFWPEWDEQLQGSYFPAKN